MDLTLETIKAGAAGAARLATEHAQAHPYQTAFSTVSFGLAPFLGAGWMTAPVPKVIGFGPLGPIAGSAATWYQSTWLGPYIPAGSLFAWCQQAAMV